jgi:hypothetical protein
MTAEFNIVSVIEELIMGKTAPKGHEKEWALLYLAGSELRRSRLKMSLQQQALVAITDSATTNKAEIAHRALLIEVT